MKISKLRWFFLLASPILRMLPFRLGFVKIAALAGGFVAAFPFSLLLNLVMGASYYVHWWPHVLASAMFVAYRVHAARSRAAASQKPASEDPAEPSAQPPVESPSRMSRRGFLVASGTLAAGWGLHYGYAVERHEIEVLTHHVVLPGLPPSLEDLKIVMMADIHCGRLNSQDFLRRAVRLCNEQQGDIVMVVGDFISRKDSEYALAAELVSQLKAKIPGGVVGTLGNHDHWHNPQLGRETLTRAGLRLFDNRSLCLTGKREWRDDYQVPGLCLAGAGDLWNHDVDLEKALEGVPRSVPRFVMAHNPDTAELFPNYLIDLMVSGHTHGGQVRLPGAGALIVPSNYGNKYSQGLVQGPNYPVYVNRGIGVSGVPLRIGAPPEITVFRLRAGAPRSA